MPALTKVNARGKAAEISVTVCPAWLYEPISVFQYNLCTSKQGAGISLSPTTCKAKISMTTNSTYVLSIRYASLACGNAKLVKDVI